MIDNFNRFVVPNLDLLAHGLWVTVRICTIAFVMAVVIGAVACVIRLYVPGVRYLAIGYIEFARATPIIVQLLWVNYVWPDVFGFPKEVEWAGIIALAIQSSGYLAETFRSGIEGLTRGQWEAGLAVGMSRSRDFPPHRRAAGAARDGALDRQSARGDREGLDARVRHRHSRSDV